MGFKCGIVGLPNVGKSTLFNCLTSSVAAEAANYPFCTIDPNVGIVKVPDSRLSDISALIKPKETIPTTMEFVDIAGLVAGASKGEGLGNQFLGHIREVNAIAQVVRCFNDENVTHVEGSVDPLRDIEVIETELQLADLDSVDKRYSRLDKVARSGDKEAKAQVVVLEKVKACLEDGNSVRTLNLSKEDAEKISDLHLLTEKKVLYVCNVSEDMLGMSEADQMKDELVGAVFSHAEKAGARAIVVCGKMEEELAQMDESERVEFMAELGVSDSGLNRMIHAGYELLGLQTYFTAGEKEVRAWTVHAGATAPEAAGVIHTDFQRGFIKAEIYNYKDLMEHKSESAVKEAGLMKMEGKEYIMKDGDIAHFRFNV
jgi:GTP-binding protein YchF